MRKIDVMDALEMEKYEEGLKAIKETKVEAKSHAEEMKVCCQKVKEFFINLFGEEIIEEEEILKGWNYALHYKLLCDFIAQTTNDVAESRKAFDEEHKKIEALTKKYALNRAQRRAGKK